MLHESVLLKEAIDALDLHKGDVYLDATLGNGGHMVEVIKRMGDGVIFSGIDADADSIDIAMKNPYIISAKVSVACLNFRNIDKALEILKIPNPNKILFDLGWNSFQFEEAGRGFSFRKDEPLIMTFNKKPKEEDITAYDVVNSWDEENLADIIYGYGEEKYARRIAKAVVLERQKNPIKSSLALAEIIERSVPNLHKFKKIHPATKTFQAIRIAVNDEIRALEEGLSKSFEILSSEGRIAVISFHSLEDRVVKKFFRSKKDAGYGLTLNKKPIIASFEELERNPRSRSAKLRIIEKVKNE